MADTSRVQVYQVPEVTYGVTPAAALKETRFTGESLKFSIASTQSKEIRQDRQVSDLVQTGAEAQGGVNYELSYGAHDDMIAGAMMADWGATLTLTGTTISASSVDNSFNFSGNNSPVFVVGQWLRSSGFATAANNGYFQVVSRTAGKIVVSGSLLTTEAAAASVTVKGCMIRNGTTKKSFTLEKKFSDLAKYFAYTGMMISNMNLSVAANEIVTGDFQFMGKSHTSSGATVGTGAPTAAAANTVLNAVSNVAAFFEGGSVQAGLYVKAMKYSLNNNLRGKPAIGVLGNVDVGLGDILVTGQMSAYFENDTMYQKFLTNAASSTATRFVDAEGNALIITMPKIKYSEGSVVAGGSNQDVMVDLTYQAMRDPTTGCTIQIDRFDF